MICRSLRAAAGMAIAMMLTAGTATVGAQPDPHPTGYTDTPYLPGSPWRVHDDERPRPEVIDPGTASTPEQPGRPPSDAIVLFDGTDLSAWERDRPQGGDAHWLVQDGYMEVRGGGGIRTRESFGDCQLHVEWATPTVIQGKSQGRGNSGILLMGRYEVQVLDSYDNVSYADGQAGALYGQYPPMVNASRAPGEWQTYDIVFTAPRFDENGQLKSPGYATVFHNGVLVQYHRELLGPMVHRAVPQYQPHPDRLPISLQEHGNPVRYRNIWIRPLNLVDGENGQSVEQRADAQGAQEEAGE